MPQVPPSPTLTNPDMILPDLSDGQDSTPSPRLRSQRPPSPPSHLLRQSFQLAKPPPGRRSAPNSRPTSSRTQSNDPAHFEGFDEDFDGDTTPKGQARPEDETARGTPRTNVMQNWQKDMERIAQENARSAEAGSEPSSAGFDAAHPDSDGSGSADDSDGRYGSLPYVAGSDEDTDNEQWLDGQEELDLEAISSAALSKRAEMILANAKKRLNLMEGNLRGARQSLLPPQRPPSYTSYHYYKRTSSISPTLRGSGPVYIPQPKHASFQTPPLSSNGSSGHTRVHSELSISSPPNSFSHRSQPPEKRAVSAMGRFSGQWSPHDFSLGHTVGNRSSGLRGVRSQEVIRHTWVSPDQHNLRSLSRNSNYQASPTLETLREDEDYNRSGGDLRRSASTTSDLRAQMQDLKGRISNLKERAREEGMKRRSLQNLRTPSPFTAAQIWENGTDRYQNSTSPYNSSRGSDRQVNGMSNGSSPVEVRDGGYHERQAAYEDTHYEDAEENSSEVGSDDTRVLDDLEASATDEFEDQSNEQGVDGESIYEDAPQTIAERHEDRADAFDYEHFFLHSAMGTYTREKRSTSVSSEDSVETTRPASPPPAVPALPESALSPHRRTRSQESISTVATFQTATEGHGSGSDAESEESNEALDQFTEQALGHRLPPKASNQSLKSTSSGPRQLRSAGSFYSQNTSSSGQRQLRSAGSFYSQNIHSPGTSTPDTVNDPTARILSSFFSPHKERGQLTPLKQKDEDLLYALTTSIQQVCARLQNAQDDDYETKIWRRRLDAARKILDGVPNEEV
ncbi:hypothetical protein B0J12DRAFT_576146 [Macrophomina phaseolina]|uniref:Uncharacterized protein n=1 Tax=Macrophomina phaseolina TaxID=35725 RepID=A0ABQ8G7N3_9PEZI|nr:hypothetical protein B0J12DRAFT_576146 [Macrophomina phaseolina]